MANESLERKLKELAADTPPETTSDVPKGPQVEVTDGVTQATDGASPAPTETQTPAPATDGATRTDTQAQADAKLAVENEALRNEVARLTAMCEHREQTWRTFGGMHKAQVVNVGRENAALKQELADLRRQLESVPKSSVIEERLKKRFGERWDRMDEDTRGMWIANEEAHEAEISGLRRTTEATRAPATNDRDDKFWAEVERQRPGFRAAMENDVPLQIFLAEPNPLSGAGLTYAQCIERAAESGSVPEVVGIADAYTATEGRKFEATAAPQTITPRQPPVMPSTSTGRPPPATAMETPAPAKPRFPKVWADAFLSVVLAAEVDERRRRKFQPKTVKLGSFSRSFSTPEEMRALAQQVESASLDDRLD